jgi:hypothetical protein
MKEKPRDELTNLTETFRQSIEFALVRHMSTSGQAPVCCGQFTGHAPGGRVTVYGVLE